LPSKHRPKTKENSMNKNNKVQKMLIVIAMLALAAAPAVHAQSDVASIVTGATTTFGAVATLCVAMGVFFIGYRIAKRVR